MPSCVISTGTSYASAWRRNPERWTRILSPTVTLGNPPALSEAGNEESLLNRVGGRCGFPPFLPAATGTSVRLKVPGKPLDDRRQLVQVPRFGVRCGVGGD